jgi:hypothetical protein
LGVWAETGEVEEAERESTPASARTPTPFGKADHVIKRPPLRVIAPSLAERGKNLLVADLPGLGVSCACD